MEVEVKTISTESLMADEDIQTLVTDASKTVDFQVNYPKDYAGQKVMAEGSIHAVAPDAAEYFTKLGIGKIKK